jgi:hypothetical protein
VNRTMRQINIIGDEGIEGSIAPKKKKKKKKLTCLDVKRTPPVLNRHLSSRRELYVGVPKRRCKRDGNVRFF